MSQTSLPQACPISIAIDKLASRVAPVTHESLPILEASGRILAQEITADRDSPACDVSAMDGYAFRYADWARLRRLPVRGQSSAGNEPFALAIGTAATIFTGAPLPQGADTVVQREMARLSAGTVEFDSGDDEIRPGRSVRHQGENVGAGKLLLPNGSLLTPQSIAIAATFGSANIKVFRPVRVAVLNSGSELITAGMPVNAWQVRDSNGPLLRSMLERLPFVELIAPQAVDDDMSILKKKVAELLAGCDVLLLTGGVSAGDYDYVPQVLKECGVETVFHKLPMRPGKPVLGGVGPQGQLVCGLPGNPVSVAVTARRIALPLIRMVAGAARECLSGQGTRVKMQDDGDRLPLVWYRLAQKSPDDGTIALLPNKGSGDIVSLGMSDGMVEINPFLPHHDAGWLYYSWTD